jgi:chromosome partitioning protein
MKITVGNLKGGTAKTTSAVLLALALGQDGRTLLVDADPQASASDWAENTEDWPEAVTVIPWATRDLAKRVGQVAGDYDHIVIDTGPEHDVILRQALMATDHLIVPVAPSPMELRRLSDTFELAAEVDAVSPVWAHVMLCKVRENSRAAAEAIAYLEGLDLPTFETRLHLWDAYLLAWGSAPDDVLEYADLLKELHTADETKEMSA